MRKLVPLLLTLMLSACSALEGTPKPAPPVTGQPQEIQRNQTQGLVKIGTITAVERGSPDDTLRVLRAKAAAAKADYYQVLVNDETVMPGEWYGQAILFRKAP